MNLVEETICVGGLALSLLRPRAPEDLLDEEAFARDEFLPYWAELWPSALALARALPESLNGVRVVELGAGLGVPSLVAAARGAQVTALDWAASAVALLDENADRNGLRLEAIHGDWRSFSGSYELVLGSDLLYEERNADALLGLLPSLAPEILLAEPGRPHAARFLMGAKDEWTVESLAERVYRLTRATPEELQAPAGG